MTHRLAARLREDGHDVEIWTGRSHGDDRPSIETIDGLPVRRFLFVAPNASLPGLASWPFAAVRTLRSMHAAKRSFDPDLLHVQCFSNNGAFATLLSMITGVPLVVTLHGETFMDDHDIYEHSRFLRLALRLGLHRAYAVTGCSKFTVDDCAVRFGLPSAKSHVIFNGIDMQETEPQPIGVPFERYVLGLGRVVRRKGFDLLVDAWAELAKSRSEIGLVIAGSGSALEALESQVARNGLDQSVHFTGAVTRGQVATLMANAQVLVMPSRVEAFGLVVLEAWRAGTPAIVSAYGGAQEFVEDNVTGIVVRPDHTTELTQAVARLLDDSILRMRIANAARDRLADFAWSRVSSQYEALYRQAVRVEG